MANPSGSSSSKKRVAVLISGNGSNLQALIDAIAKHSDIFPATIALVISNKAEAYGLERAKKAGIATEVVSHRDYPDRLSFDQALHQTLEAHHIDLVCLAGFMRIITPFLVEKWHNRMINIHPSLLPSFKGANGIQDAFKAAVPLAGCSVHLVRNEVDAGPIIGQAAIAVSATDTLEAFEAAIHRAEHLLYPASLYLFAKGLTLEGDKITASHSLAEAFRDSLNIPGIFFAFR